MRATSIGIDMINVNIPPKAFNSDLAERAKVIAEKRKNYECLYDLYIALALPKFQDREYVVAP